MMQSMQRRTRKASYYSYKTSLMKCQILSSEVIFCFFVMQHHDTSFDISGRRVTTDAIDPHTREPPRQSDDKVQRSPIDSKDIRVDR